MKFSQMLERPTLCPTLEYVLMKVYVGTVKSQANDVDMNF